MTNIPRPEHPKPQFMRENWINLNGEWEFQIDAAMVGRGNHFEKKHLDSKILVPFCPESKLSGVEHTDFMNSVWYRREIEIPKEWEDKRKILHFGAVDYQAFVYVNGTLAGEHKGGYTSFSFDITDLLQEKDNYISVCAVDLNRQRRQPCGKQSWTEKHLCYSRITGIWQTVWLEAVPNGYIKSAKYDTDIQNGTLFITLKHALCKPTDICRAIAYYEDNEVGRAEISLNSMAPAMSVDLTEIHLWELGKGRLYDLLLQIVRDGEVIDSVQSYFGLRSVDIRDNAFCLNGKKVFGRWVLDQGYFIDGLYTAPSDEILKRDIEYGLELGFNGARLHEKIFEERYLYWADKMGYMVWEEHANWGLCFPSMNELNCFLPEWMEAVERDYNHPSIIGWAPFNENWPDGEIPHSKEVVETVYHITKAMDKTRPVIDTSGLFHTVTDIYDVHDYEQDPEKFKAIFERMEEGILTDMIGVSEYSKWQKYDGKSPFFVSEYGGIGWVEGTDNNETGGYGNAPKTKQEFIERYKGLTEVLLNDKRMLGFCYTQLYDIEHEKNGLLTYDRKYKFDPEIFREINMQKAAIETDN